MAEVSRSEFTAAAARAKSWGKGTVDALLIYLLSGAFDIATRYQPVNPVVPVYRELLEHWRSKDEAVFRNAMQRSAQQHIAYSGEGTDDTDYEFEFAADRIFPLELLVIQALRQRDALPAFDTGHALIDAPWAMLRGLPQAAPHPLLARVDRRLRQDYPGYR